MRRQYVTFTGGAHGVAAVGFIRRALERGHASIIEAPVVGRLYHLGSKPLYAALGETDNRNRRLHSASSIRRRLMALDFILAHPNDTFLATERDRMAYFVDEQHLPPSALPTTAYASADGRATTTRFFVDKLPIAVRETGITFAYIDDDEATVGGFATFLERHRALFAAPRVKVAVVFVTTVPRHVARADAFCAQALGLLAGRDTPGIEALTAYVRARLRLEQGRLSGSPQQELDALRRDLADDTNHQHQPAASPRASPRRRIETEPRRRHSPPHPGEEHKGRGRERPHLVGGPGRPEARAADKPAVESLPPSALARTAPIEPAVKTNTS